jgi:hypothetical protein
LLTLLALLALTFKPQGFSSLFSPAFDEVHPFILKIPKSDHDGGEAFQLYTLESIS